MLEICCFIFYGFWLSGVLCDDFNAWHYNYIRVTAKSQKDTYISRVTSKKEEIELVKKQHLETQRCKNKNSNQQDDNRPLITTKA